MAFKDSCKEYSSSEPCPKCGKQSYCFYSLDGRYIYCRTPSDLVPEREDKSGASYWRYDLALETPGGIPDSKRKAQPVITPVVAVPMASIDVRAAVYGYIFSKEGLGPYHFEKMTDTMGEGWNPIILKSRQYISAPNPAASQRMVSELIRLYGEEVKRVPGIIETDDGNGGIIWTLATTTRSIWIPVRNVKGQIIAVKVRYDDPKTKRAGKKPTRYNYLSSSRFGGAGAEQTPHVPLWRLKKDAPYTAETVRVTEGEKKADWATGATRILTISSPGSGVWKTLLPVLEELQAKTVKIAFDMDALKNISVAKATSDLFKELSKKYTVELETWDDSYKGIDDVLRGRAPITTWAGDDVAIQIGNILTAAEVVKNTNEAPLPELPAFVREKLAAVMPTFTSSWINNLDKANAVPSAIASILGQAGIEANLVGAIIREIAFVSSERNPESFGYSARMCATANLKQPIPGMWNTAAKAGIKEALVVFQNQLVEELKPDPFNIRGLMEMMDKYDLTTGKPLKDPTLPRVRPIEPKTDKPWVTLNSEDLGKSLRRRLCGFEVDSFPDDDVKKKTLKGFCECNTISRFFNHDKCDQSEYGGTMRCQTVACLECRQQIAFLAKEFVKSTNYGNWPDRIVIFETLLTMEPSEVFPSRNNVNVNIAMRNLALNKQGFLDDAPRTVVETDRLRSFMAVDPLKTEAQHITDLQNASQVNVRIVDKDAAIEIYYNSLLVIARAIDRRFEDEDINLYFDPDDEERQIATDSIRSILTTVNQTLGRRFVLGGRGKLTLPSGLSATQQKTARRKYNFEEEQLDPNILNPKKVPGEMVFADGCKCKSTSYIDGHFATEHLNIPGYQEDDITLAKAARYAWDSGEAQASLREYCTPTNMALDNAGHLERLPKTQRVWAPPEAELASV